MVNNSTASHYITHHVITSTTYKNWVCVLWSFSAQYLLFELLYPSCQLKSDWLFSSDLSDQQGIPAHNWSPKHYLLHSARTLLYVQNQEMEIPLPYHSVCLSEISSFLILMFGVTIHWSSWSPSANRSLKRLYSFLLILLLCSTFVFPGLHHGVHLRYDPSSRLLVRQPFWCRGLYERLH